MRAFAPLFFASGEVYGGAMRLIRPLLLGLSLVVMLVTAQAMAVARGTTRDAAGAMVLCTGSGPVTVFYDENGEPIGPSHLCPDCALSVVAGLAAPVVLPAPATRIQTLNAADTLPLLRTVHRVVEQARAPPVA